MFKLASKRTVFGNTLAIKCLGRSKNCLTQDPCKNELVTSRALRTASAPLCKKKSIYDQGGPKSRGIELLRDPSINKVRQLL